MRNATSEPTAWRHVTLRAGLLVLSLLLSVRPAHAADDPASLAFIWPGCLDEVTTGLPSMDLSVVRKAGTCSGALNATWGFGISMDRVCTPPGTKLLDV